jgi:hypothetical protein
MGCSACGAEVRTGSRFCGACGAAFPGVAAPGVPAATVMAAIAVDAGTVGTATPRVVSPTARAGALRVIGGGVKGFFRTVQRDRTGLLAAATAVIGCVLICVVGTGLFAVPTRLLRGYMPRADCGPLQPGTAAMYVCSAQIGFLTVAGPLLIVIVFYLLRAPLRRVVALLTARLPEDTRFLIPPVISTIVFAICWTGIHPASDYGAGILPLTLFPSVVGLYTFAAGRWGDSLARLVGPGFFDWRDRYPALTRLGIAMAIPAVLSLTITFQQRVSQEAMKEQVIVLVALVCGYVAMSPRSATQPAGLHQTGLLPAARQ